MSIDKKYTTKEFINKSKIIHNNKYDYSLINYINSKTKVKIVCKKHGIFEQTPCAHINNKQGCPKCSNNIKLSTGEFILNAKKLHQNNYDYSLVEYKNNKTKVKIICKEHGIFEQTPCGCPKCNESKNEKKIKDLLEQKQIKFETQKTFDGCLYKRKLKFDFYLPDCDTCIEYDGEQHFVKYRFEKDNNKLKSRQKRDKIKTDYCKNNNINLIRIKYDENINEKLTNLLK